MQYRTLGRTEDTLNVARAEIAADRMGQSQRGHQR